MSKNQQFQKFITYKSNAAKKEQFKQEKRSAKKERAAAIDKRFEEKRQSKSGEFSRESMTSSRQPAKSRDAGPVNREGSRQPKPAKARVLGAISREPEKRPAVTTNDKQKPTRQPRVPKPGSLEEKKLLAASQQAKEAKPATAAPAPRPARVSI